MLELIAVDTAICALLKAVLTDTGVYSGAVPEAKPLPAVVYSEYDSIDRSGPGASRIFTRADYLVRVIDRTKTFASMAAILAAVDGALQKAITTATVEGKLYQVTCHRVSPFSKTERLKEGSANIEYRHAGGIYRFFVSDI